MSADELSAPLGQDKRPRQCSRNGLSFLQLVTAGLGALAITFVGWAVLVDDPLGGEPVAIAPIDLAAISKGKAEKSEPAASQQSAGPSREGNDDSGDGSTAAALPPSRTVTIIDGTSGQRREIVIPGAPDSAGNGQSATARASRATLPKAPSDGRPSPRTISVR